MKKLYVCWKTKQTSLLSCEYTGIRLFRMPVFCVYSEPSTELYIMDGRTRCLHLGMTIYDISKYEVFGERPTPNDGVMRGGVMRDGVIRGKDNILYKI